jgi:hypothetical protein
MGRYGIGARVKDPDGDEGVIVAKRKGERQIEYVKGYGNLWWDKPELTPIANDNGDAGESAPSISPEISEVAYTGEAEAAKQEWVPKVGERVRRVAKGYSTVCPIGFETEITKIEGGRIWYIDVDGDEASSGAGSSVWEPVVAPATTAPLTIEAGKFYRTRDGRKVGPMILDQDECDAGGLPWSMGDLRAWHADGRRYDAANIPSDDLVAEWVEEPAAAEPAPKFKVGDRVNYVLTRSCWQNVAITGVRRANGMILYDAVDHDLESGSFREEWLEPTATPTIGSNVTFTATGRLSAINENGHYQVTFPLLAPGQNSFALPAQYVTLAD